MSIPTLLDHIVIAGHDGGTIVFEGTPADLVSQGETLTAQHLARYVGA